MPTYRTNALYQAPTVDNAVYEQFGMQPGMDRLNLLPRHDAKLGWIAPNALYQIARALVSPSVAAQGGYVSPEDAVNFAGNVSLGSLGTSALVRNPAPGPGRTVAQTVYHGSPHNFDKFDMSKIGTGEGAQAYGHGLYVAENPNVAKSYTNLAKAPLIQNVQHTDIGKMAQQIASGVPDDQTVKAFNLTYGWPEEKTRGLLEQARKLVDEQYSGRLYHVDLPDQHIANMLDWDKPLSQQPESVRRAINSLPLDADTRKAMARAGNDLSGSALYHLLSVDDNIGSAKAASDVLRKAGVSGIRYLDGSSRGAGDGTRNFVVFDDKLLKVLKKE